VKQVQRELKAERTMDDERDFFDGPSTSAGKKRAAETRIANARASCCTRSSGLMPLDLFVT
jgi:hypothetical protein